MCVLYCVKQCMRWMTICIEIHREGIFGNPKLNAFKLAEFRTMETSVSIRTVRKTCKKRGFRGYVQRRKLFQTKNCRKVRISFAKQYIN